jgi:hypothetical protein
MAQTRVSRIDSLLSSPFAKKNISALALRLTPPGLQKTCVGTGLYAKHYHDFDSFTNVIQRCLHDADTIHAKTLRTLLTLNFQTFENAQL